MSSGLSASPADCAGADDALATLVDGLARRGLAAPALFLLEVASPFRLLIQQALLVAHPLLASWAGDGLRSWAGLLDDEEVLAQAQRRLAAHRRGE